ncbi:FHA domain-containing protein [Clostridium sp. 19966]|uniref:DUF6382 domain-containing protein n=1 Tax=Clostridium sp. 19966 TaxID=2768166 RepID=UPI0028E06A1D|nr:DUF6382 domain-containing protein [Clostridium sp. 19966]MDT8718564.1 FHA domain-containing protein [Clostridium sp. 19966]
MGENVYFDYNSNGLKNFLVCTSANNKEPISYQIEMINNNYHTGINTLYSQRYNETFQLFYDISSKLTLKSYLMENKLNKQQFIGILKSIGEIIASCENYFLCEKNFIFDLEKIYVCQDSLEIQLIYVPLDVELYENVNEEYQQLAKSILVDYATIENTIGDNFVERILGALKSASFNLEDFLKLLKDIDSNKVSSNNTALNSRITKTNSEKIVNSKKIKEESVVISNSLSKEKITNQKNIHQKQIQDVKYEVKKKYRTSIKLISLTIQLALIIVLVLAFMTQNLDTTSIMASVLLAAAADILILRRLLSKNNLIEKKIPIKEAEIKISKQVESKPKEEKNKKAASKSLNQSQINLSKREIVTDMNFETELLTSNNPYLLLKGNDGTVEKIYINKNSFVIGRLQGQADYICSNKTIGKTHAKIDKIDIECYITDLNSKNGSYINGERLVGGQQYLLQNDDLITLSDINFIFKLY